MTEQIETFRYDDRITRMFLLATVTWALVGMSFGVYIAFLLFWPEANLAPWLTFGRLRPVHTNAVIFAFACNIFFTGMYYSTQRLCRARMWSDKLSLFHFWGWQTIIVVGATSLLLGYTQSKEYAELEWPLDLAIAVVWVAATVNFVMTLVRRREKHMYVALWFYLGSLTTVAVLHVFNNLSVPFGWFSSYSVYSGVHDALMQWWYGHNAVAFVLTTPFLGLMYYFLPKAAERPVYSYTLSIIHFWALIFVYIWAGPHHLHYTSLPGWAGTLGMVFSVVLWAPSWGGMLNGLLTLRGAWHKLREDPVLKFLAVGVTYYGMSTFEGPMMAVKSVNSLSHYTDWTIGHVHAGTLGWNAFIAFGVIYWLLPRLYQTELWSRRLAEVHFWIGTAGILLYQVAMWVAGITQGLMWRAFEPDGRLMYPDFIETVTRLLPMYQVRFTGGVFFLTGMVLLVVNVIMTVRRRGADFAFEPEVQAPALRSESLAGTPGAVLAPRTYDRALFGLQQRLSGGLHRMLESMPLTFTVLTVLAIAVGSLVEAVPLFLDESNVPKMASVRPYTPLEQLGRDLYRREGCYLCHSQQVRPFRHETERYGEYSKGAESVYDHPFQWGSKRTGPDLQREGGRFPNLWHVRHLDLPVSTTPGSIMPAFTHLALTPIDTADLQARLRALASVGVPYSEARIANARMELQQQAQGIAADVERNGGPLGLADKEITAMTAYLQRLGTDIKWREPRQELLLDVAAAPVRPPAPDAPAAPVAPISPVAPEVPAAALPAPAPAAPAPAATTPAATTPAASGGAR